MTEILSRGECLGITLPRQWRHKAAGRGEHPALLLSYRGQAQPLWHPLRQQLQLLGAAGDVISWEHPFHWGKGQGGGGPCDSCRSDQKMLLSSVAKPEEALPCAYGIFYLRFPVVDSPAVRCLLLLPRENSKLCKSSSQVFTELQTQEKFNLCPEGRTSQWLGCLWVELLIAHQ